MNNYYLHYSYTGNIVPENIILTSSVWSLLPYKTVHNNFIH